VQRVASAGLVAAVLLTGAVTALGLRGAPPRAAAAQQDEGDDDEDLAPLTLDAAKARPLEGPDTAVPADRPVAASVAENAACYVCHANYQTEELVTQHAAGDVGCVDCHGKSYDHRNDENNTTPPDVMFPRDAIDTSCAECHDEHDVPAADVIERLQERAAPRATSGDVTCTDCHGRHRLPHRTVVWDRTTRALVTGQAAAPPPAVPPADLGVLGGVWVRLDPAGTPAERLTITVGADQRIHATWESEAAGASRRVVSLRY
jgi:hypothetical protein